MSSFEVFTQKDGVQMLVELFIANKLVPIFGSGISKGATSSRGTVPNGPEATALMKKLIIDNCPKWTDDLLSDYNFNETAQTFIDEVDIAIKKNFFKDFFTGVALNDYRADVINLEWPYAYTLNVDDGIEKASNFIPVLPYKQFNKINNIKPLYKLHGDALEEVLYDDRDNIIFSDNQYLISITSENNTSILNNIISDYNYKNLVFWGCSLIKEQDIEYVYSKIDKTAPHNRRIVFLDREPNAKEESRLKRFGANTVILVDDFRVFSNEFVTSVRIKKCEETADAIGFKNPTIELTANPTDDVRLLAEYRIFSESSNKFTKSPLFALRDCVVALEKALEKKPCAVFKGRRFSGKTIALSLLMERLNRYNIYYFPSTTILDDNIIEYLLENGKNSLFIFDSNSLSRSSYNVVMKEYEKVIENDSKIVFSINTNDLSMIERMNAELVEVSHKFFSSDREVFNKIVDKYGLIKRKSKDSNIDYVKRLIDEQNIDLKLPFSDIKSLSFEELVMTMVLCSSDKIFYSEITALGIQNKTITDILRDFNGLIESIPVEKHETKTFSSLKLVSNSRACLLSILRTISDEQIISCVSHIVKKLKNDNQRKRIYIDITKFDTLNQLFGGKTGAGELIFKIYFELENYLYDNTHFWLQRAKSIYNIRSDSYDDMKEAYKFSKKAYGDSIRTSLQGKTALSASIVCCILCQLEKDEEKARSFQKEAIELACEAIFSKFYPVRSWYIKDENVGGKTMRRALKLILDTALAVKSEREEEDLLNQAEKVISELSQGDD